MENKLVYYIITAMVGILLIGTLMTPVINDMKQSTESLDSDLFDYYATDEIGDYVYEFSSDGITFNGTLLANKTVTMASDCWKLQWYNNSATLFDKTAGAVSSVTKLTIGSDGSYSYVVSDTETESANTITKFIGVADSGDYVANGSDTSREMIINSDSEIYVIPVSSITDGSTTLASSKYIAFIAGTYDALTVSDAYYYVNNTWTAATTGSFTINNYTENSNGTVTVTGAGGSFTLDTYTKDGSVGYGIYVPYQYTVQMDMGATAIIAVIPVIFLAVLVVAAVGLVTRKD